MCRHRPHMSQGWCLCLSKHHQHTKATFSQNAHVQCTCIRHCADMLHLDYAPSCMSSSSTTPAKGEVALPITSQPLVPAGDLQRLRLLSLHTNNTTPHHTNNTTPHHTTPHQAGPGYQYKTAQNRPSHQHQQVQQALLLNFTRELWQMCGHTTALSSAPMCDCSQHAVTHCGAPIVTAA